MRITYTSWLVIHLCIVYGNTTCATVFAVGHNLHGYPDLAVLVVLAPSMVLLVAEVMSLYKMDASELYSLKTLSAPSRLYGHTLWACIHSHPVKRFFPSMVAR